MKNVGTVKFWDDSRGFGFIVPDDGGKDVFVHVTAVKAARMQPPQEGDRIAFDVESDKKGLKAVDLAAPIDDDAKNNR